MSPSLIQFWLRPHGGWFMVVANMLRRNHIAEQEAKVPGEWQACSFITTLTHAFTPAKGMSSH